MDLIDCYLDLETYCIRSTVPLPSTILAVVVHEFGPESRKSPALRWLESLATNPPDAPHVMDHSRIFDYCTDDFSLVTPHGEPLDEDLQGFASGASKFYTEPFSACWHVPYTMTAVETADGYDLHTQAHIYGNIVGADKHEENITDENGRGWEARVPIFYHHDLVRVPGAPIEGLKLRHCKIIKDTGMIAGILKKRDQPAYPASPKRYKHHADHVKHNH